MILDKIDITKLDTTVTLADVIGLLGGSIYQYPVMGTTVILKGFGRKCERDIVDHENVMINYEFETESLQLNRIYIGHKFSGPMLSCSECEGKWVWRNLYSKGNYGKNASSGGNWYSDSRRKYDTASEALDNRDYKWDFDQPHPKYWTESTALLNEMKRFVKRFE